jgi:hypothetical protein
LCHPNPPSVNLPLLHLGLFLTRHSSEQVDKDLGPLLDYSMSRFVAPDHKATYVTVQVRERHYFLSTVYMTFKCDHFAKTGSGQGCIGKNALFEQFIYKNDHFAKTGSGQRSENNFKKRVAVFLQLSLDPFGETGANCIIIDRFSAFEPGLVAPFLYVAG